MAWVSSTQGFLPRGLPPHYRYTTHVVLNEIGVCPFQACINGNGMQVKAYTWLSITSLATHTDVWDFAHVHARPTYLW